MILPSSLANINIISPRFQEEIAFSKFLQSIEISGRRVREMHLIKQYRNELESGLNTASMGTEMRKGKTCGNRARI